MVFQAQTEVGHTEQDGANEVGTKNAAKAPATTTEAPVILHDNMIPETQELDNEEINDKMDNNNSDEKDDLGNVLTTRGLTFQAPQERR